MSILRYIAVFFRVQVI